MKIKAAIFDLDDTLYDYSSVHGAGMDALGKYAEKNLGIDAKTFITEYNEADEELKAQIPTLAACHNRILIAQRTLERLHLPSVILPLELYEVYWGTLLRLIKPKPGAAELLKKLKAQGTVTCLCTDMTAHIQHRKLSALGLGDYLDFMVCSEEAGAEKPAAIMFELALKKTGCAAEDAVYIGDNFRRDIEGAASCGIYPIWLNDRNQPAKSMEKPFREISCLTELL